MPLIRLAPTDAEFVLLADHLATLAEREERISSLIDRLDLSVDEFERIFHLTSDEEIKGICKRSQQVIFQTAPVIIQRDQALQQITDLQDEFAKYKAFWEYSRLADKRSFELYEWPRLQQEHLGSPFEKVLKENLWNLYEEG
jgi:hypothetical protein